MNQKASRVIFVIVCCVLATGVVFWGAYVFLRTRIPTLDSVAPVSSSAESGVDSGLLYKSPIFLDGVQFEVTLPEGWQAIEEPDDVAVVGFFPKNATAWEGVGSKVYRTSVDARTFAEYKEAIQRKDASENYPISYKDITVSGLPAVIAAGYPGIVESGSTLYVFTGTNRDVEFVDPPFDARAIRFFTEQDTTNVIADIACGMKFESARFIFQDYVRGGAVPFSRVSLSIPSTWRMVENYPAQPVKYQFREDVRVDHEVLMASFDPMVPASAWSRGSQHNTELLEVLGTVYEQRSLQDVDRFMLEVEIFAAHAPAQNSFTYIESSDGEWRGYYYVNAYATQDFALYRPYIDFVLMKQTAADPLVFSGKIDLDSTKRLAFDLQLERAWRDGGSATNALLASGGTFVRDTKLAIAEILSGIFPPEMRCQIDNAEKVLKSLRYNVVK